MKPLFYSLSFGEGANKIKKKTILSCFLTLIQSQDIRLALQQIISSFESLFPFVMTMLALPEFLCL